MKKPVDKNSQAWGERLKTLRKQKKISRIEAATFFGVSVQQIRKYEIGESALTLQRLQQFAQLFQYPFSTLLTQLTKPDEPQKNSLEEETLLTLFRQFTPQAQQALIALVHQTLKQLN